MRAMRRLPRVSGLERIGAFSDGVFAIAITLLVLDLKVPTELTGPDLGAALAAALGQAMPRFFTFALSFVVIGQFWYAHQRIFSYIRRYDARLVYLNLAYLFFVTLVPFPTSLVAEYGDQGLAVAIYAANMTLAGLCSSLLWWHSAWRRRLVDADLDGQLVALYIWRGLVMPVVFGLSIPLAFLQPTLAMVSWLAIIGLLRLVGRHFRAASAQEARDRHDETAA
jgi:uncharacterized membrane protein